MKLIINYYWKSQFLSDEYLILPHMICINQVTVIELETFLLFDLLFVL